HRDPVERWTDRCPLPLLGLSVVFAIGAAYYLLLSFTTPLFPFFGRYLTGLPGAAVMLVMRGVDGYLAFSLFRKQMAGWWLAVVALSLRLVSAAITYRHADLMQAYAKMGWTDERIQMMSSNPVFRGNAMLWWGLGSSLMVLGYLFWVKRYFRVPVAPAEAQPSY